MESSQPIIAGIAIALRGELQAGFAHQSSQLTKEILLRMAITKVDKCVENVERGLMRQIQKALTSIKGAVHQAGQTSGRDCAAWCRRPTARQQGACA